MKRGEGHLLEQADDEHQVPKYKSDAKDVGADLKAQQHRGDGIEIEEAAAKAKKRGSMKNEDRSIKKAGPNGKSVKASEHMEGPAHRLEEDPQQKQARNQNQLQMPK